MNNFTNCPTRHVTSKTLILVFTIFGFVAFGMTTVSSAGNVIVVTTTIQAAIDAASPGDTIFVPPGIYYESVRVTKDYISIVGSRGAIIDAGNRIGIRVGIGSRSIIDGIRVCPPLQLHNFTLNGLTIKNARFAGVFLIGVDGYRLTGTRYLNDLVYGPFPVCSQNGVIEFNSVEGGTPEGPNVSTDAGIYVGDSDTVTVKRNSVTNHAAGIEIENTSNAVVSDNVITGNSGGILVFVLPGLDKPFTDNITIEGNQVLHNNIPNPVPFDPGPTGEPLGQLPTGTGILSVGADHVVIRNNRVIGNDSLGIAITQNPFAALDPRIEPNPDHNEILRNVALHNGLQPDQIRALTPGVDIAYDGSGEGTCFTDNVFSTQFPVEVISAFPCL
jgi:parallel beta-helix repeat protein